MRLIVKGKNVEVTDALQQYGEKRLGKLAKLLDDDVTHVELELCEEHNPRVAERHVAEATVWAKGPTLRACQRGDDMYACIDNVADKLMRQATKAREKRLQGHQHGGHHGRGHGDKRATSLSVGGTTPLELADVDLPADFIAELTGSAHAEHEDSRSGSIRSA